MEDLSDVLKRLATRNTSEDSPAEGRSSNGGPEYDDPGEQSEPCPRCGGRGWYTSDVPVGHPEFGTIVTCDCQQDRLEKERTGRLLRYSNLGHLTRYTFESLKGDGRAGDADSQESFRAATELAREYAEEPSGWLVIKGPHGAGKTHLAAAIGYRRIEKGEVVFFVHVPDLLDHLRSTFSPTSETSYSELFEQVRTTALLILDGLGVHGTTPWAEEKLRQILGYRFNGRLPTVVTTATELAEIDPFIASRLRDPQESRIVELGSATPEPGPRLGRLEPAMLSRMTFEKFDVRGNKPDAAKRGSLEAAFQAAKAFAADPDGWLTLLGDTGVGKTHLAVAVAAELLSRGGSVFFAFVPELLDHLRYTFRPDSTITYDRLFEEVKGAPLLVLDDLGKERSSPWAVEKLYQIIVHRHNARLPTVITTMVDFTRERDPIASRVQDPSIGQLVSMDAPDYRHKGRRPPPSRRGTQTRAASR